MGIEKLFRNPRLFIPLFLALGILYRAFLVASFPQPFIGDETQYHDVAVGILTHGIFADDARTFGYPMIVAVWYKLFGVDNQQAWKLMQILADTCVALFVYIAAKDVFGRRFPAAVSFVLYIASPFAAGYAGVLLSEVSAVFFMALFLLLWHRYFRTNNILYLITGVFCMAFVTEIRPAFLYFMAALFAVTLVLIRRAGIRWYQWILLVVAFAAPFVYATAGNYQTFHRITPFVVDGGFGRQLVASEVLEGRVPQPILRAGIFPEPIGQMEWDLRFPYEAAYRNRLAKAALTMGIDIAMKDPAHFIRERINKAWYVWEKHFLFVYLYNPEIIKILAYSINEVLLVSAAVGMLLFGLAHKTAHQRIFLITSIALILYTSLAHSISIAEERYSLPVYPVLFIFAGYAISKVRDLYTNVFHTI